MTEVDQSKAYDAVFIPLGAAALGGAERSIAWLAEGTQRKGKRVLLLAERALQNTYYPEFVKELNLQVHWVDWAPERTPYENFREAWRVFRSIDPQLIQFNISWRRGMWMIPLVARLVTRAKLVGSMRGMPDPHQTVPRRRYLGFVPGLQLWHLKELVAGWIWGRVLGITVSVNGQDFPPRLIAHYGYPRERLRVIHNGVVYRDQLPGSHDRRALRESVGACGEDDVLIAFVGRLSEEKGVDLLLRSLATLPTRYKLVLAGDGPALESLRRMAEELGVADRARFLGFIKYGDDLMACADMVTVPSTCHEACSRVVVEALGQGAPVIGSRIGGTPELVEDGVEGLLVDPGSVESLTAALRTLGEDRALRERMRLAARARAHDRYRMESVVARYHDVYRELVPEFV